MSAQKLLHGFSKPHNVWFHTMSAAQRYAESVGWPGMIDFEIQTASEDQIDPTRIMDTEETPWRYGTKLPPGAYDFGAIMEVLDVSVDMSKHRPVKFTMKDLTPEPEQPGRAEFEAEFAAVRDHLARIHAAAPAVSALISAVTELLEFPDCDTPVHPGSQAWGPIRAAMDRLKNFPVVMNTATSTKAAPPEQVQGRGKREEYTGNVPMDWICKHPARAVVVAGVDWLKNQKIGKCQGCLNEVVSDNGGETWEIVKA